MVLHALRVLPAWEGRGYARAMVEHAIRTARAAGQKALRLDCIEGNDVPVRLYRACGFRYVDTVPITLCRHRRTQALPPLRAGPVRGT